MSTLKPTEKENTDKGTEADSENLLALGAKEVHLKYVSHNSTGVAKDANTNMKDGVGTNLDVEKRSWFLTLKE